MNVLMIINRSAYANELRFNGLRLPPPSPNETT